MGLLYLYWLVSWFRVVLAGYVILTNKTTKKEHKFVDQNYIYCFTLPHVSTLRAVFRDLSIIIMLLKQNVLIKDKVRRMIENNDIK